MVTLKTLDSSVVSLIILVFIYVNAYNRSERVFTANRLFSALVEANMLLITIDILGWAFNGLPGPALMFLNKGANLLLYIMAPAAPSLWLLYINHQVNPDKKTLQTTWRVLIVFFSINAVIAVSSLFTGWYFTVDAKNIYRRGDFFWAYVGYCYALIAYSFFFVLLRRRMIEKRYFYTLLLFFVPPTIGTLLQTFNYGVSYNWTGMMLSLLIIYFNIQDRGLNTDYLTGAYNRRQMDGYIKAKIRNSTEENSFSAILFDLDDFKQINDRYGHDSGDEALKDAVAIIRKSLRQDDFVARVGGDEFIAIIDISNAEKLGQTVKRIAEAVREFNLEKSRPFLISFSMGYDVYDPRSKYKFDDFFKHIDMLMYRDKKAKRGKALHANET